MKKISVRVFTFVLALIMCIGVGSVNANKALAAEVPTITIAPLVTESVNQQAFQVYTEADAQYKAYYGGGSESGSIPAGTKTLTFNTSDEVNLEVFASYVNDEGSTKYVTVRSTSINAYWAYVYFVAEDDTVIGSDKIKLSKHNEPQVVYNAQPVIDNGAFEYHTANPSVVFKYGDTAKYITYTSVAKGSKTITVNYVDDADAVLYTETMVLNYGDTAAISAPAAYTANGSTYALKTTASYDVTYENAQSVYTFEYAKQAPSAQLPYEITINLVDENGATLNSMKASVDVGKQVTVNLPATYEVGMKKYALAEGQAASIVRDYASAESKTYTVKYVLTGEAAPYTVTVTMVDRASGAVLSTVTATIEPDGAPYTYTISSKNTIVKDGVTYQVLSGQGNSKGKIVHAYGDAIKSYTLYYSAKQESIADSYAVNMRYICVNNSAILATETQIVDVNSSVTFDVAPETLTIEGKEYIRLNGQGSAIVHNYNDTQKNYEIYYRDASIEVDNDDIIYVPGTNVDQGGANQPDGNQPDGNQPAVPDNDNTAPDTGADAGADTGDTQAPNEPVVEPDAETGEEPTVPGEDVTGEEIIEEDEVPLANAPGDGASEGKTSVMPFVGGGVGLAAIIAIVIALINKKRKTA